MTTRRPAGRRAARYLLAGALGAMLAGCGGGGSGDTSLDPTGGDINGDGVGDDVNGDGLIDVSVGGDSNFDGIPDADLDRDGVVDDVNGDGIVDFDLDGDGYLDVDANGNGVVDLEEDEGDRFVEPSAANPCGSERGTDPDSSTPTWDDNCTVSRYGQWRNSLYTAGIQRVVYCAGFGTASSVDAFADGDMGPATAAAIEAFQEANGLTADAVVGPQTWGVLQDQLEIDPEGGSLVGGAPYYAGYTVPGGRCGGEVLFYERYELTDPDDATAGITPLGWELSSAAGSTRRVPFSIEQTRGRLER